MVYVFKMNYITIAVFRFTLYWDDKSIEIAPTSHSAIYIHEAC